MKLAFAAALIWMLLQSCNPQTENKTSLPQNPAPEEKQISEKPSFFPVTSYIKGQLFEIMHKGVNPLRYRTKDGRTDSSWIKIEELPAAVSEFLKPEIDSLNLISLFTEKKFMDQTIDALTFTYDPTNVLPDSMNLVHWDVYINPATGKVKRVYMVKEMGKGRSVQLTWQGDKWCKTLVIRNDPDGTSVVEKEEKITWDF